ncbi:MAG TPA: hypothetical protein VFF74_00585 [Methylophilaceae bacterium]|nr:hypothetical protein [Methylophilaceae bacterium]
MKTIFKVLGTAAAITALTATAGTTQSDLKSSVMAKAADSKKGVIVVLSDRGDIAADAAFLLSAQLKQNPGFAPLLVVPERDKLQGYMKTLALPSQALPAVIFFNKSGKEIGRVVGAKPVDAKAHLTQAAIN